MDEKRHDRRFRINQLIGYFPNREEYLWAEGHDMSRGGISCSSTAPVDPMTNVFVMVGIPSSEGEKLVRCEGYVAHARMEGGRCVFGIKIMHVSEEDLPILDAYIESQEKEKSES
jgi:hypothetical protein